MSGLVKRLRDRGSRRCDEELISAAARIDQLERELALEKHKFTESEKTWMSVAQHANDHADAAIAELAAEKALADRLKDDLFGIEVYASDTISGPSDGVPDLKWLMDGVEVLHDRAVAGRDAYRKARGL